MVLKRGALALGVLTLGGCDVVNQLAGIPTAAESRAVGASCRHVGRSLETCYQANKQANKAEMYAGWKEMNDYMKENNIQTMPSGPLPATDATAEPDAGAPSPSPASEAGASPTPDPSGTSPAPSPSVSPAPSPASGKTEVSPTPSKPGVGAAWFPAAVPLQRVV